MPQQQSPGKVLVVDDDPDTLHLTTLMLQRAGFEVIGARSGMQALDLVRTEKPEAVILDVMMPQRSGLEVLHTLRATHPWPPPVILFTAKGALEDMVTGREAGAFRYLVKPAPKEKVLEAVRDAVAAYRSRPPLKPGRI